MDENKKFAADAIDRLVSLLTPDELSTRDSDKVYLDVLKETAEYVKKTL